MQPEGPTGRKENSGPGRVRKRDRTLALLVLCDGDQGLQRDTDGRPGAEVHARDAEGEVQDGAGPKEACAAEETEPLPAGFVGLRGVLEIRIDSVVAYKCRAEIGGARALVRALRSMENEIVKECGKVSPDDRIDAMIAAITQAYPATQGE